MHMNYGNRALIALALGSGCATEAPPPTFDYIRTAILAPSCATSACHTERSRAEGFAFDTREAADEALAGLVAPGDPDGSWLMDVLTTDDKERRMPVDAPLADEEIELIRQWILAGAQR